MLRSRKLVTRSHGLSGRFSGRIATWRKSGKYGIFKRKIGKNEAKLGLLISIGLWQFTDFLELRSYIIKYIEIADNTIVVINMELGKLYGSPIMQKPTKINIAKIKTCENF